MATIKAFIIVALVFGVFMLGPAMVTFAGIAFAIWFVRALLLEDKKAEEDGDDHGRFY